MPIFDELPPPLQRRATGLARKLAQLDLGPAETIAWLAEQIAELRAHELRRDGETVAAINARLSARARVAAAALERFAQLAVEGAIDAAR